MPIHFYKLAIALVALLLGACAGAPFDELAELRPAKETAPTQLASIAPLPYSALPIVVRHGPREAKRIALTFDACSTEKPSQFDERVIRVLANHNVPATLFLGGKWMEEYPDTTRHLAAHPLFEIGNHTFLHPHLTKVSDERLRQELTSTQQTLFEITGHRAKLFRAPYGEIDPRVVKLAAEQGLVTVQFDLPSGDADKGASKKKLVEYVTSVAKNGSIVVMHINGRGWHTAQALPEIIQKLRKRGFQFVTVSDLLTTPDSESVDTATATPTTRATE